MVFSFGMAAAVVYYRFDLISFEDFLSMRVKVRNFALYIAFLIVWHIIFSLFRLYHSRRLSTRWEEVGDIVKATSTGSLVIFVASLLLNLVMITPGFILAFWIGSSGLTILARLALRFMLERIRLRNRNLRYMLIVGTNSRAIQLARKIEAKPELGYRLLGFVDDEYARNGNFEKSGYGLAATFNNFSTFIRENIVDEAVVCLPMKSLYDQVSRIVAQCEEQGILVRSLSDIFNLKSGQLHADQFEDNPVITVTNGAMNGLPVLIKRGLDFFLSLIVLILLTPVFLVTALLIKLTSPGPVFFVQDRIGLNKRRLRLYKFRTMVPDAEKRISGLEHLNEVSGPVFKIKNDPRITPIGKFLRKTSIDELPQLFNVLRGDMSLVGPRPLPVRDYNGFDQDWHRRRFSVRPGITCLWQINGRSTCSFDKWMKLDMEYIDKWSLWLDLKILAKTVPAVLKGSGAA
jgi:exopolysaccharide biosynthesis polyprenyl glycosylphosphotransferase